MLVRVSALGGGGDADGGRGDGGKDDGGVGVLLQGRARQSE